MGHLNKDHPQFYPQKMTKTLCLTGLWLQNASSNGCKQKSSARLFFPLPLQNISLIVFQFLIGTGLSKHRKWYPKQSQCALCWTVIQIYLGTFLIFSSSSVSARWEVLLMGPLSNRKAVASLAAGSQLLQTATLQQRHCILQWFLSLVLQWLHLAGSKQPVVAGAAEHAVLGMYSRVASCPSLLHQRGSANKAQLLKEESDPAMLQCLVRVNRGFFRKQLPLTWIHPSAAWGSGAHCYYSLGKYSADTWGSGFPIHTGHHPANSDLDNNLHWGKTGTLCSPHTACPISCPIEKHNKIRKLIALRQSLLWHSPLWGSFPFSYFPFIPGVLVGTAPLCSKPTLLSAAHHMSSLPVAMSSLTLFTHPPKIN